MNFGILQVFDIWNLILFEFYLHWCHSKYEFLKFHCRTSLLYRQMRYASMEDYTQYEFRYTTSFRHMKFDIIRILSTLVSLKIWIFKVSLQDFTIVSSNALRQHGRLHAPPNIPRTQMRAYWPMLLQLCGRQQEIWSLLESSNWILATADWEISHSSS